MADDDYSRSRLPSTYARLSGGSTKKKKKYKLRIRICNCLTLTQSPFTHIREMCGGSCLCDEAVATAVLRYKRSVWSSYEFSGRPGE